MLTGKKLLWWKLDKLVNEAAERGNRKAVKAFSAPMPYLEKPTPEECAEQYREDHQERPRSPSVSI